MRNVAITLLAAAVTVGLVGAVPAQGTSISIISGQVTLDGKPVSTEVELRTLTGEYQVFRVKSDTNGYFTFTDAQVSSDQRGADWLLLAEGNVSSHRTYYGDTPREQEAIPLKFAAGETVTANIDLTPAAVIQGRVVDPQGRPVENVAVYVTHEWSLYWDPWVRTDADGRYVVGPSASGEVQISTSEYDHPRVDSEPVVVNAVRGQTVAAPDLVVERVPKGGKFSAKITGLTKDDSIWLFNTKSRVVEHVRSGKMKKGTVKFTASVPAGTYRLVISGTNVASKTFKVKPKKTTKVPSFKGPKKRGTLTVTVKKPNGKRADTGLRVYDAYGTPNYHDVKRKKKGKFVVKGIGKGFYSVKAESTWSDPDRTVKTVVVKKKKSKTSITMRRTAELKGTVTHNSLPVQGIQIYLLRSTETGCIDWGEESIVKKRKSKDCFEDLLFGAQTDAQGRYTIADAPVGTYTYLAYDYNRGGYASAWKDVTVTKSGSTWDVALNW